jgi:hypothetical protein
VAVVGVSVVVVGASVVVVGASVVITGTSVAVDAVVGDPPPPHPPASSTRAKPSPMNSRMAPSTSGPSLRAHPGPGHRPRR